MKRVLLVLVLSLVYLAVGCSADINVAFPEINVKQRLTDIPCDTGEFDFGNMPIHGSQSISFTIENTGTTILNLTGKPVVFITGQNASEFSVNINSTNTTISPGNLTTFSIAFTPKSIGSKTAKAVIPNDDPDEGYYTFTVKGTATPPAPEIHIKQGSADILCSTGSYDFGTILINTSTHLVTFSIENNGSQDLYLTGNPNKVSISGIDPTMFIVYQNSIISTIPGGSSTSFAISFNPTSPGLKTAKISILNNDSDENPYTFNISGICTTAPEINIKQGTDNIPASIGYYDFGEVLVNDLSAEVIFTIENLGTSVLHLTGIPEIIEVTGTDAAMFAINQTSTDVYVTPGNSTTFGITFSPTSAGNKTATISIANNDSNENPYTFSVNGICLAPDINVKRGSTNIPNSTGSFDYGSILIGLSSAARVFTIENLGTGNLILTGSPKIAISGSDSVMFTINQTSTVSPVIPSHSTTFSITFTPTTAGNKSATISIANNDTDENPYTFTIKGLGAIPQPEINLKQATTVIPNSGSFCMGHLNYGTNTGDVVFTIDNYYGSADLELTGTPKIELSGTDAAMFTVNESMTTSPVAPSSTTTFTIRFTPTSIGTKYASISIANNDYDENPYSFDITGISSIFSVGQAVGWFGGGSNGWKTTNGAYSNIDYQSFKNPNGMCLDSSGNIYIADVYNNRICKWNSAGIAIGWIGGGSNGWKTANAPNTGTDYKSFDEPSDVFVDSNGYIYVADCYNHRISKWDSSGNAIGWIGGGSNGWKNGSAPSVASTDYQSLSYPSYVFVDISGNIYVTDSLHRICKWDSNGNAKGWIGGGSNGWKTTNGSTNDDDRDYQSFSHPRDVVVDSAGNIFVADASNNRVCKWASNGNAIGWIGNGSDGWKTSSEHASGSPGYRFLNGPCGLALNSSGFIFIADMSHNRICLWDSLGNALGWIGDGSNGWKITSGADDGNDYQSFEDPQSVSIDSHGYIYVLDNENCRVCKWKE